MDLLKFLDTYDMEIRCQNAHVNPCHAESEYILPLQTVQIQISWLLKKPTDLDLHCLPLSMLIYSNNTDQAI